MVVALSFGLLYTLPNFFGEAPAVQVSSAKSTVKVDQDIAERVNRSLQIAGITAESASLEGTSVRVRLPDTDTQLKAKDAIDKALNTDPKDPRFVVALNLVSSSPGLANLKLGLGQLQIADPLDLCLMPYRSHLWPLAGCQCPAAAHEHSCPPARRILR